MTMSGGFYLGGPLPLSLSPNKKGPWHEISHVQSLAKLKSPSMAIIQCFILHVYSSSSMIPPGVVHLSYLHPLRHLIQPLHHLSPANTIMSHTTYNRIYLLSGATIGVPVGQRSGGQLTTMLVATTINVIIFFHFFSVATSSHRRSARIKKLI